MTLESNEGVAEGVTTLVVLSDFNIGDGELVEKLIEHVLVY